MKVLLFILQGLALSLLNSNNVAGENILFFHLIGTSSHRTSIWPLAEQLADKGHNVTYIFPMTKRLGSHEKIEEIIPTNMVPVINEFVGDFDINYRLNHSLNDFYQKCFSKSLELCQLFYDSEQVKEWLSRPNLHYDLVFVDTSLGECIYPLVYKLKAKLILFAPALIPSLWDGLGIVPESSTIPNTIGFESKPTEMTFFNRMKTIVAPLLWRIGIVDYMRKVEPLAKAKLNMTEVPPLEEIERNASLLMVNYHFVEDYPMSLPPLVVPFSGLWCSKAKMKASKPLPEKLAKFIEKSDGFIYVSLGSAVIASAMPIELRDQFLNAFATLPEMKFFWRWTGPIPENAPANVMFETWFPQHDILAHPKIKGFISQAGRPSTQEALCQAVPIISIPVFGDQDYNADRLEYIGATINLDLETLTSEKLVGSIKELIGSDKYSKRMKELSAMFKDRPLDPLDTVVYWTEYVLKYDTDLLRPLGNKQTWWQRRLLDVHAFIFLSLIIILGAISGLCYFILRFSYKIIVGGGDHSKRKVD